MKKKCHYHFGHRDKTFPLQMWEAYFMWCELICKANPWTGFYMIEASVMKGLIKLQ